MRSMIATWVEDRDDEDEATLVLDRRFPDRARRQRWLHREAKLPAVPNAFILITPIPPSRAACSRWCALLLLSGRRRFGDRIAPEYLDRQHCQGVLWRHGCLQPVAGGVKIKRLGYWQTVLSMATIHAAWSISPVRCRTTFPSVSKPRAAQVLGKIDADQR